MESGNQVLREAVCELTIATRQADLKVIASFRLTIWDGNETVDEFLRRANAQLYETKRSERDRVCV